MRILFLAHLFPLPLDSGGKIKSFYTLRALAREHEVLALAFLRTADEEACISELQDMCPNLELIPLRRGKIRQLSDLGVSLLTNRSFIISRDYRAEMSEAFRSAVARFQPDVVHIDHLQMAQFVDFNDGYKTVLDHHNVESMIIKRVGEAPGSPFVRLYSRIEWPKLLRYELDICRKCDRVITVSEEDKHTLVSLQPTLDNVVSVPIGVDVEYFDGVIRDPASRNILSIATMYWPPNVDSMLYFHKEILPLVRREVLDCTLTIAGQRPVASIQALASDPGTRVTGYVSDSRDCARDCGVFIVPLRSGSGVRVKILNAMAMGLPVVSTSVGAEGLDVLSGEHILIVDTPEDFAKAVIQVLRDPELASRLGKSARDLVREKYSWDTVGGRLLEVYCQLGNRE
ncbi:MAG: glycosyltransferase family 4 protein [Armatimonadetes bacterium]|nr:glycosyltransferase family 4 protein [Armatimonadota bacterium]